MSIKHYFCAEESATNRLMRAMIGCSGQELIYCQDSQFHSHHPQNEVVFRLLQLDGKIIDAIFGTLGTRENPGAAPQTPALLIH